MVISFDRKLLEEGGPNVPGYVMKIQLVSYILAQRIPRGFVGDIHVFVIIRSACTWLACNLDASKE